MHRIWCGALAAIGALALSGPAQASETSAKAAGVTAGLTEFSAQDRRPRDSAPRRPATPRISDSPRAPRVSAPPRSAAPRIATPRNNAPRVDRGPNRAPRFDARRPRIDDRGPRVASPPRIDRTPNRGPGFDGRRDGLRFDAQRRDRPRIDRGPDRGPRFGRGGPDRPRIGGSFRRGPVYIGGREVRWNRGRHYTYWRGSRRAFVPLAVLGGFTLGSIAYSAAAYVPVEAPYCAGITEDGCELRWQEVPTEDGFTVPQCVAFCPSDY
jgi:hypothetical protein